MGLNYSCNHSIIESLSPRLDSIQVIGYQTTISMTMCPMSLKHFRFMLEIGSTLCPLLFPNELFVLRYFQQSVKCVLLHGLEEKFQGK